MTAGKLVPVVALQINFVFPANFQKSWEYAKDVYTVLLTSREHTTGLLVKAFGSFAGVRC